MKATNGMATMIKATTANRAYAQSLYSQPGESPSSVGLVSKGQTGAVPLPTMYSSNILIAMLSRHYITEKRNFIFLVTLYLSTHFLAKGEVLEKNEPLSIHEVKNCQEELC